MADNIRGLTVEIAADATKFKSEMKQLRSEAKSSQSELNALQKSLALRFDEKEFVRAQEVAREAIDKNAEAADLLRERLAYLEKSGNVDTAQYRDLQTQLTQTEIKGKQLQEQLERIKNIKYTALANQVKGVGNAITGVGQALTPVSALAAGAVAGVGALGVKAISTADEIATLATQYEMSAEALQRFNYVALQTDTDATTLYKAFVKVRAGVADIAAGATSTATAALQALNLNFAAFDGSEEQFYAIVDALASMEDKTQMVALANDIFGDKLANNLLPMIYAGTDAINEYREEFDDLGALTNEQVAALSEFDNVLNKIKTQLANVAAQIGSALLPLMQRLADIVSTSIVPKLQRLAEWFDSLSLSQQEFALKAALVVAALAPLTLGIGKLVTGIGSLIAAIPKLMAGLSALAAHPIILIVAAVVAVLVLLYAKCEAFREAINALVGTLGEMLQPVLSAIGQVLQLIMSILQPIIDLVGGVLALVVNVVNEALQPVVAVLNTIMSVLSPIFDILSTLIGVILMPLQIQMQMLFSILQPLLQVALIPLQLVLQALQVPLQILGTLLGWLSPLFTAFANVVKKVFMGVITVINFVLGFVEDAVNFVIGIINGLIDGVNGALGWLGVHIDRIAEVKLKIDTSSIDDMDDVAAIVDSTPPDTSGYGSGDTTYDAVGGGTSSGDVYNNDYSTNTKTQNVTVVIQNYAAEIDEKDLVRRINVALAEGM